MADLLGRVKEDIETEQPVLRIDMDLHAGAHPNAQPFVLPEPKTWSRWVRMVNERLAGPDRPVSDAVTADGIHMSWRGQPEVTVTGNASIHSEAHRVIRPCYGHCFIVVRSRTNDGMAVEGKYFPSDALSSSRASALT